MSDSEDKVSTKRYRSVKEQYCSRLGENAIIITTVTERGEVRKCIDSEGCDADCEHNCKSL